MHEWHYKLCNEFFCLTRNEITKCTAITNKREEKTIKTYSQRNVKEICNEHEIESLKNTRFNTHSITFLVMT